MSKLVAVTGGSGTIGKKVVFFLLKQGYRVRLLLRDGSVSGWRNDRRVEVVIGDVANVAVIRKLTSGTDGLIHLAAEMDSRQPWEVFERTNIESVKKILKWVDKKVKVLMVSSVVIYEDTGKKVRDEKWNLRLNGGGDKYVESKLQAQRWVRKSLRRVVSVMPSVVVDLKGITEVKQVKMSWWKKIIWQMVGGGVPGGIVARIGDGGRIINFVDVGDVSKGIVLAWEKGRLGEEYILAGVNLTADEYLMRILRFRGSKMGKFRLPLFLAKLMRIGSLVNMNFTSNKAIKELGYKSKLRW